LPFNSLMIIHQWTMPYLREDGEGAEGKFTAKRGL
jgi:hypothetical protein